MTNVSKAPTTTKSISPASKKSDGWDEGEGWNDDVWGNTKETTPETGK